MKRALAAILAFIFILPVFPAGSYAISGPVGTISGESGRFYENIILSDGTDTGVRYTEMNLSGTYGSGKILRLAECDLSDTNISIDVINCGSAAVDTQTVASASKSFSSSGKTVLCALNGDLWMTKVNSNSNVTKKVLKTTRGIMMIDGEIWATQEFGMENYQNTSNPGTVASLKSAFGITDENQPLVGAPVFTVTVTNESKGSSLVADGLNRLPAWDSLVVYNHRINSANYALNDSYEIELVASSTAFTVDNKVTAMVKAIYPSGSATRPTIGDNTIILTARGSRMAELSSVYSVGDTVSFDFALEDKHGRTELWQNVTDAIGGHLQVIKDDQQTYADTSSSEYPTSLIGVKDDGTVMFANVNASTNGDYKGLRFKDAYKLCSELGYNSVFYLDGGGSSAIVTLKDGTYTQRNYSSDGNPRAVINAVAITWDPDPVCKKQGSLAYLRTAEELQVLPADFLPAGVLERLVSNTNDASCNYSCKSTALRIEPDKVTVDPFVGLDLTRLGAKIDTFKKRYIVVKLKTNATVPTGFSLYYYTDASSEINQVSATVTQNKNHIYLVYTMAGTSGWSGDLTYLRLDPLEGITSSPGTYVDIEYVAFTSLPRDTALLTSGEYPENTIIDYYAYKDCSGSHSYAYTATDLTSHKAVCKRCKYSFCEAHEKDNGTVKSPSCTENGYVIYSCKACNTELERIELPPSGHSFSDEYTVDVEPTYTTDGSKSRHCKNCSEVTDVTVIPALRIRGDANGDGKVNSRDSYLISKAIIGHLTVTDRSAFDLNGDEKLTAADSNLIKRIIAGRE